jgi:uncharacterized membrane protein
MTQLILGLVLFLGVHSIAIVASDWRNRSVTRLGPRVWRAVYSLLSIVGFVLLIRGYGIARQTPVLLYTPASWTPYLSALLMLPVFPLFFATYLPGRIKTTFQHTTLAAVKFWALAHLLANGTVADVLLFGSFLAWAVADRISYRHRSQKAIPAAPPRMNDAIAVAAGLATYAVFVLWLHERWIGVPALR